MSDNARSVLEDFQAPTKIKLSLLWTSLMFLYIYNDYFSMYLPGTIERMSAGRIGPLGQATDLVLVGRVDPMAIPALMIFLSASLPGDGEPLVERVSRGWHTRLIEALTFSKSALFYKIVVALEIGISALIVWYALRWPKRALS